MTLLDTAAGVELLDDPAAEPAAVRESLRNIARGNRWFGGWRAVRIGLGQVVAGAKFDPSRPLSLLDIGTGAGDLPRRALSWAARRGIRLQPIGLERHPAAARLASESGLVTVIGDGGVLPFRDRSIDVVMASQLVHHFAPASIVRLLRECNRVARLGVVVADLRRSEPAAFAWRFTGPLLRFDHFTVNDGITSLRRGFSVESLQELVEAAGFRASVVRLSCVRLVAVWRPTA